MKRKKNDTLDYLDGRKKLSATELKFMEFIWEHPEGISSEQIYENKRFHQATGTKSTILYNISEKGYIRNVQQGRHHIYYPNVTKLEYEQAVIKQRLKRSFEQSSFTNLFASFFGKNELSEKQIKRIEQMLEEIENEFGNV